MATIRGVLDTLARVLLFVVAAGAMLLVCGGVAWYAFSGGKVGRSSTPAVAVTPRPVADRTDLKNMMAYQLSRPVLWVDLIKKLGIRNKVMTEVGPGAVISRTVIWIDRNIEIINTAKERGLKKAIERCS